MQEQLVNIRWMTRLNIPEILDIEDLSFEDRWSKDDFIHYLRQRTCVGKIAETNRKTVGFVIYEHLPNKLHILNLAVHPDFRRRRIGRAMIDKLVDGLLPCKNQILLEVRETNLTAQLFFRDAGFRAMSVLRGFYDTEDGYLMQYTCQSAEVEDEPVNRAVPQPKPKGEH